MRNCKSCNTELPNAALFCFNCGKKVILDPVEALTEEVKALKQEIALLKTERFEKLNTTVKSLKAEKCNEIFPKVFELMKKNQTSFKQAFSRITGEKVKTNHYSLFKKWLAENESANLRVLFRHPRKAEKNDKRITRMAEINSRARTLMDENISKKEAYKTASAEYMLRQKPVIPTKKFYGTILETHDLDGTNEFPDLVHVSDSFKVILIDIVNNVVKSPYSCSISYQMEGKAIGINSLQDWHEFVTDFCLNSGKIARYFQVYNQFKTDRNIIRYG